MKSQLIHQDIENITDEQYEQLLNESQKRVSKLRVNLIPEFDQEIANIDIVFARKTKDTIERLLFILTENKRKLGKTAEEQRLNAHSMLFASLAPWRNSFFKPHTIGRYIKGSWIVNPVRSEGGHKGALVTKIIREAKKRGAGSPNYPQEKLSHEVMSKKAKLLEETYGPEHWSKIRANREVGKEIYANLSELMLEKIAIQMDTSKKNGFNRVKIEILSGEVVGVHAPNT